MSTTQKSSRITVPDIRARKKGEPVVCISVYTAPMARVTDAHADLLLVGDSLGMVLYGFDSTLPVTLDMMIAHTGAVMRGSKRACVILDMPFASYQESPETAYRNAARVLKETGCAGVKVEGGVEMAETIRFLTRRGIPVMGHVGLLPQSLNTSGGYRIRGRTTEDARAVIADAKAVADAGVFSMVVEGVVEPVARRLTRAVPVPTIGIGASVACDGQVLVADDVLGLFTDFKPKFVKRYAELGRDAEKAVAAFAADIRARRFPGAEHTFATSRVPGAASKKKAAVPKKKGTRG